MKFFKYLAVVLAAFLGVSACAPKTLPALELARSVENSVEVIIMLTRNESGQVFLSATFAPAENELHLYSKDTPRSGVDGLGRPALIELPQDSAIKVTGVLVESAPSQPLSEGFDDLLVYPAGAVTLSLPVTLPAGKDWLDQDVIVTYMACSNFNCRPPVEGKIIPVRIPQNEAFN